jgi:hypothetical protein
MRTPSVAQHSAHNRSVLESPPLYYGLISNTTPQPDLQLVELPPL